MTNDVSLRRDYRLCLRLHATEQRQLDILARDAALREPEYLRDLLRRRWEEVMLQEKTRGLD
jgi:hypothetical protein